ERLWWLLRHLGHDDCAVMDLAGWQGPLTAGDEAIEPQTFTPRQRQDDTIEADELARRLGELVVVDARLPERWRGEENPIDKKLGRIPGAHNATWNGPLPELPEGELVAYCGSGVTAAVAEPQLARYGCQPEGIFGAARRMNSTGAGGFGRWWSSMLASSSSRFPFLWLQGAHAVTTFSQTDSPPRERGTTWSSVRRPDVVPQ